MTTYIVKFSFYGGANLAYLTTDQALIDQLTIGKHPGIVDLFSDAKGANPKGFLVLGPFTFVHVSVAEERQENKLQFIVMRKQQLKKDKDNAGE